MPQCSPQSLELHCRHSLADNSPKSCRTKPTVFEPPPAEKSLAEDYRLRLCPRKACTKIANKIKYTSFLEQAAIHNIKRLGHLDDVPTSYNFCILHNHYHSVCDLS